MEDNLPQDGNDREILETIQTTMLNIESMVKENQSDIRHLKNDHKNISEKIDKGRRVVELLKKPWKYLNKFDKSNGNNK